jgi:hypothetical protein
MRRDTDTYDFEKDGKFYCNSHTNKGKKPTVYECRRCDCGKWISVNTINRPSHKAKPFHTAWATANGQPITKDYNIGSRGSRSKKPKKEDLVASMNKIADRIVGLTEPMNRLTEAMNRLAEVIEKMDATEPEEEDDEDGMPGLEPHREIDNFELLQSINKLNAKIIAVRVDQKRHRDSITTELKKLTDAVNRGAH